MPRGSLLRIEHGERSAGLEHRQHRRDQLRAAVPADEQRDMAAAPGALRDQRMSEAVGAGFQRRVGCLDPIEPERGGVGRAGGGGFEQTGDVSGRQSGGRRHRSRLRAGERQVSQQAVRRLGRRREQSFQRARKAVERDRMPKPPVALHRAADHGAGIDQRQSQVEFGDRVLRAAAGMRRHHEIVERKGVHRLAAQTHRNVKYRLALPRLP